MVAGIFLQAFCALRPTWPQLLTFDKVSPLAGDLEINRRTGNAGW
jgi:hypothetical protein